MKKRLTLVDLYDRYTYKDSPESKYYVTKDTYLNIIKDFSYLLIKHLVQTGRSFRFPGGLGVLEVKKRKASIGVRKVDFQKTKELGKVIYHTNSHSNGYYALFKWDTWKTPFVHSTLYCFKATRNATRYLSQQIKDNNTILKYLE